MYLRRLGAMGEFDDEDCKALRSALKKVVQQAATRLGVQLELSHDIENCYIPDDTSFYISGKLYLIPRRHEDELEIKTSVFHGPYKTLRFNLIVGDLEDTYEIHLQDWNCNSVEASIRGAFSESEVVYTALKYLLEEH